ncbi:LysR family transcriptional regulator [Erwinia oleae]|uniref:LysR family transcriptional regulator n=1 Tax=Erwinia oleae TaxID=796334 RepID=UPI00054DCCF8|nr:LysR family transcriptional regulator [Erwinia oleae]
MIRLDDLQIFVQTADAGSFSEAARQLNISPGRASSAIQRLEGALGVSLLLRSTRSMQLSENGKQYLPHAREMLAALARSQQALALDRSMLSGRLTLSAPSDFGRNLLQPWLDRFQRQHPEVSLHLKISDRAADLLRQPLDVAIRYGELPDSSLIAMPIAGKNRRTLCASPAYLARCGRPGEVSELLQHNCLRFIWSEQVHERWRFTLPTGEQTVSVAGNRISDDADVVRRWAIAGEGVVYKSRLDVIEDIVAGRLIELFPGNWCEPSPLHLVCAHRSKMTPLVVKLLEFLRESCRALQARLPESE